VKQPCGTERPREAPMWIGSTWEPHRGRIPGVTRQQGLTAVTSLTMLPTRESFQPTHELEVSDRPENRISRWRRWLLWLGVTFVAYSIVGCFLLPPIIQVAIEQTPPGHHKRQATVRQVKVNPWALSLTVRGLALTKRDERTTSSASSMTARSR